MNTQDGRVSLIVDDSKIVRRVTHNILKTLGFGPLYEAENGQVALDMLPEMKPDLIMLDWHMPVMDGLEFLKAMRVDSAYEHTKVVFCTTETQLDKIQAAMVAGASEYVMKPFDEDIIRGKLEQLGLL